MESGSKHLYVYRTDNRWLIYEFCFEKKIFKVDLNFTTARKGRFRQCLVNKNSIVQLLSRLQILESGSKHLYVYRIDNRCLIYEFCFEKKIFKVDLNFTTACKRRFRQCLVNKNSIVQLF